MSKRKRRTTSRSTPAPRAARTPLPWLIAGVFVFVALILYWNGLRHPLVFDDQLLRDDFLKYYGASIFRFDARWLSYASFGWTYDIAGKQWLWHRLINVLLHAATAFILFRLLSKLYVVMLGAHEEARTRWHWLAALGALLFLLHPVAVYGVAYLVQRSILMATLFSLLSLSLFLEGLTRQRAGWLYAAVASYFAAVFSKEHCVMLPAVALALAVLVRGPSLCKLRDLALPFALFAGIAALITLRIKGVLGAPYEPLALEILSQFSESSRGTAGEPAFALSIVNQCTLFFRYLVLWLVPYPGWKSIDLRPSFPLHLLSWPHAAGFVAWLAWFGFAATQLCRGGARGLLGFVMLFPWLLALTEMSAVRVQEPMVLYRSYLWMCILPAALPLLLARVPLKWACAGGAILCTMLMIASLNRLATFASPLNLWDDAVRHNQESTAPLVERSYHNRGFAHLHAKRYAEALADFSTAIAINPLDANAWLGRATLYTRTGSHAQAIDNLNRALEIDPRYAEAYAKRCFVRMIQGDPPLALTDCEKAVALNPRHRDALTNRGVVYTALNRVNDAAESYRRALQIDAANADAHYNFGVLYLVQQRMDEARPHLKIACDARIPAACDMLPPWVRSDRK
jgi:Tfp pilus assembly protein PilF